MEDSHWKKQPNLSVTHLVPVLPTSTSSTFFFLQLKSAKGSPDRAHILLSALNDLMNTLFSYPVDKNLICAVKLLKVSQIYTHVTLWLSEVLKMCCELAADRFRPGRRVEGKW